MNVPNSGQFSGVMAKKAREEPTVFVQTTVSHGLATKKDVTMCAYVHF